MISEKEMIDEYWKPISIIKFGYIIKSKIIATNKVFFISKSKEYFLFK